MNNRGKRIHNRNDMNKSKINPSLKININSIKNIPLETKRLLHDLELNQLELEIQNEELKSIQENLELANYNYYELYNRAPVGYVTLNKDGIILEANLTIANMLGLQKNN